MEEAFYKCNICIYRDESKENVPCSVCSDNMRYVSRFKEHPVAKSCREILGLDDDHIVSRIAKENAGA